MENIVCNKWIPFEDVHNQDFLHGKYNTNNL
jgi:hypothetical protein